MKVKRLGVQPDVLKAADGAKSIKRVEHVVFGHLIEPAPRFPFLRTIWGWVKSIGHVLGIIIAWIFIIYCGCAAAYAVALIFIDIAVAAWRKLGL